MRCIDCGKKSMSLHYGRCKECFDKWPERLNPEPDAKKHRKEYVRIREKGRRGAFVVKIQDNAFYTPKKKDPVPQTEAFVFYWLNSAIKLADELSGHVLELLPSKMIH